MSEYFSKELRAGLAIARKKNALKKSRLRVQVGEDALPILKFNEGSFEIDAENAPQLRGHVEIYDGARHLYQALIVASHLEDEKMVFEFKRNTPTAKNAPVDFEVADDKPVGLLPAS